VKGKAIGTLAVAAGLAVLALLLLYRWNPEHSQPTAGSDPIRGTEPAFNSDLSATPDLTSPSRRILPPEPAAPGVRYFGIVSESDRKPLEGARLTLFPTVKNWREQKTLGSATSGPDGRFEIEVSSTGEPSGRVTILAEADGYAESSTNAIAPEREITISLPPLAELFGTVLDAETGEPIPGALVLGAGEARATCDKDGRYRLLPGLRVGIEYSISACKAGYAREDSKVIVSEHAPKEHAIRLRRGVGIRLELFDEFTGGPVVGSTVEDVAQDLGITDDKGGVELRVVEGSEHVVDVRATDYADLRLIWKVPESLQARVIRLPMRGLGWIEGVVTDENKNPLAGCTFTPRGLDNKFGRSIAVTRASPASADSAPGSMSWNTPSSSPSDSEGRFAIPVLPGPAQVMIEGGSADCVFASEGPVTVSAPRERVRLDVVLRKGGTVRGSVRHNGELWTSGDVYYQDSAGKTGGFARLNAEGRFELRGVPPGQVTLKLRDRVMMGNTPLPTASLVIEAGKEYEQNFDWREEMATITGRVVDSHGLPIAGHGVSAVRHGGRDLRHFSCETAADGSFVMQVLPEGSYDVSIFRYPTSDERSDVPAGAAGIELTLPDIGKVRLQFIDGATGDPIRVTTMGQKTIQWRKSGSGGFGRLDVDVGQDGRIELELPVGSVDVAVVRLADVYITREMDGIVVPPAWTGPPLVVELRRGAAVNLSFLGNEPPGVLRAHVLFLLHESQVGSVIPGPTKPPADGINFRVTGPGILEQQFAVDNSDEASLRALLPGRQIIRCIPGDLVFDPPSFELPEPGVGESSAVKISIHWRSK